MIARGDRAAPNAGPTARARSVPLAAFVLHRYDWSESSLILDLFTRDQGRLTVVAKGAKRPYSQLRPVLLPFQRLNALLSRVSRDESTDIHNLRGAEWAGGGPMLPGAALFSGFYLNELLMRLLARHDPHPVLFDAYAASLPALASAQEALVQASLRAFEIVLLREIGLLPQLDVQTGSGLPLVPETFYALRPEIGLVAQAEDIGLTGQGWLALHHALQTEAMPALQRACLEHLPMLKLTLRPLLHYHLDVARLRTRDVMIDAQQFIEVHPRPSALKPDAP